MSTFAALRAQVEDARLRIARQSIAEQVFESALLVNAIAINRKVVYDMPPEHAYRMLRTIRLMENIVRFRARCVIDTLHQQAEAAGH